MPNNPEKITTKQFLKKTSIIHFALLAAPLLYAILTFWKIETTKMVITDPNNPLQYIVPISAIIAIIFGNSLFNQQIKKIPSKKLLSEKLTIYQIGLYFKLALLEGIALLGILAFKEEGNLFFFYISITLMLIMLLQKPNKIKIEAVLNLSMKQRSTYNKPNEIID
jgi:hypothetical protein